MLKSYCIRFEKEDGKKSVTSYLSNYVRCQIRNSALNEEDKNILLTYPTVYIHAWKNDNGSVSVYVGETNDLVLRVGQHAKDVDDEEYINWHNEWLKKIDEGKAFSWFFSCEEMNKSLCKDIENSLFKLMKNKYSWLSLKTENTEKQLAYSNKSQRDSVLEEIWSILKKSDEFNQLISFDKLNKGDLTNIKYSYAELPDTLQMCDYENIKCEWMKNYPVLYIYFWVDENREIHTYVGETDNIEERHDWHLKNDEWADSWMESEQKRLIVFAHRDFNKSMTLDLENRLITYMVYSKIAVNRRYNEQGNYNNQNEMYPVFCEIIQTLLNWQSKNEQLENRFKTLEQLKEDCVSLVSFYKLNKEQIEKKVELLEVIEEKVSSNNQKPTVIILYGGAGTGKTVLLSSLLFDLIDGGKDCRLVVNNKELAPSFQKMMKVRELTKKTPTKHQTVVYYAADFFSDVPKCEILLVDESHLLNIIGHERAKPQLDVIADHAKVTVLVFDPKQFVDKYKKWNCCSDDAESVKKSFCNFFKDKGKDYEVIKEELNQQMRMQCEPTTREWINTICTEKGEIRSLQREQTKPDEQGRYFRAIDKNNYEICVFSDPELMKIIYQACRKKDKDSMMIATYDWAYDKPVEVKIPTKPGCVVEYTWHTTGAGNKSKSADDVLSLDSWIRNAEENEIGAYHDIQGFDLKYAFVVIGPSISYDENGIKVIGKNHRTNHDPELILNELRVLLTRGANGLYLYACNKKLRAALINALKED